MTIRTTGTTGIAIATLTVLLSMPWVAHAAGPNLAASSNELSQAAQLTKRAESFRERAEKATGDLKDECFKAAEACQANAEAKKKVAAALAAGDEEAVKAARAAQAKNEAQCRIAQERVEARQTQAAIPSKESFTVASETDKGLLETALTARQNAITAGNTFVAAIIPEASQSVIEIARDAWLQSQDDLAMARRALTLANERAKMATRPGAADPAAAAKLTELAKIDEDIVAAAKAAKAQTLQGRILERKRAETLQEFEKLLKNAPKK